MATPEAPPPDAIHCFSCGSLISKEAKFCSECGADQNESTVPRPYTKYCYNCGDSIAETAAFCPACGADQEDRQIQSPRLANAGPADDGGEIRDNLLIRERDSDPERWENWHLVVASGLVLTFVGGATAEYVLVLMGYLASIAGLYYDTKYVRTVSRWKPATAGYIVGTILLMIVVVPIYLYRRHKEL